MYHRSDSCIQLGVMNLWFPPLNNMTLSVCFGPPLGTPVFHSCPTKCWCYIILYPVNYILYPMICFFFCDETNQRQSRNHPATIGVFTPSYRGGTSNSPWKYQQHFQRIRHAQGIQNSSRLDPKHSETNNWWLTYPSEKWWSSSFGVIIPNIWKNKLWGHYSQYISS